MTYSHKKGWLVVKQRAGTTTMSSRYLGGRARSRVSVNRRCSGLSSASCSCMSGRSHITVCSPSSCVLKRTHRRPWQLDKHSHNPIPTIDWIMEGNSNCQQDVIIRNDVKHLLVELRNRLKSIWHKVRNCKSSSVAILSSVNGYVLQEICRSIELLRTDIIQSMLYVPVRLRTPDQAERLAEADNALRECIQVIFTVKCNLYLMREKPEGVGSSEHVQLLTDITKLLNLLKMVPTEPNVVYLRSIEAVEVEDAYTNDKVDLIASKLSELQAEIEQYRSERINQSSH
eukprot:GHVH01004106.1.p1 GENE.GHVH01004106.1~~GHVH01004106.1.p1  ORF type:complete len:286 (+),score=18.27 GHVH01004106.1:476-1333(+)